MEVLQGHAQGVCDVAWSHRGDRLASASDDGTVRIWQTTPEGELNNRAMSFVEGAGVADPDAVHWCADGVHCAVVENGGSSVSLWELREELGDSGRSSDLHRTAVLTDAHDVVTDARWSADGEWLAVVSRDRTWLPRVYDRKGTLRPTPRGWTRHASFLSAVDWHPLRAEFAVAGQDNLVTVNTLDATVVEYRGDKVFTAVAWHPEGTALAVGCTDGTVLVLDRGEEGLVARLPLMGHRQDVLSFAWSPDGTLLLSGSADETVQLWDVAAGGRVTVLNHQGSAVREVGWRKGTRLAFTRTETGEFYSWDISDALSRPQCGPTGSDPAPLITEARLRAR